MIIQIHCILPLNCDFAIKPLIFQRFREIGNESVLNIVKLMKNKDSNSERYIAFKYLLSSGFIDINRLASFVTRFQLVF